jgi:RNA polymerase sigma factor (sigma-70 family)
MSETDLIIAFNEQNNAAFTEVYERLWEGVYYYSRKYVTPEDANDIVGDVFEGLWKAEKNFTSITEVKAYLIKSAKNACIRKVSREKTRTEIHKDVSGPLLRENPDWLGEKERIERRIDLCRLIESLTEELSEEKKDIFMMAFIEGMESREIAEKLNIDPKKVWDLKNKMLTKLRASVAKRWVAMYSFFLSL